MAPQGSSVLPRNSTEVPRGSSMFHHDRSTRHFWWTNEIMVWMRIVKSLFDLFITKYFMSFAMAYSCACRILHYSDEKIESQLMTEKCETNLRLLLTKRLLGLSILMSFKNKRMRYVFTWIIEEHLPTARNTQICLYMNHWGTFTDSSKHTFTSE